MSDINNEMLNDFVGESKELLETIEEDFLELEKEESDNTEVINKLFRAVHTIKGSAGFVGLLTIGSLAHSMETLMSKIRDRKILPNSVMIDTMLAGADKLKVMINNVSESNDQDISEIIDRLNSLHENKASSKKNKNQDRSGEIDKEIINTFIPEAAKLLTKLEKALYEFERDLENTDDEVLTEIYRHISLLKGTSGLIGLTTIELLAGSMEKLICVLKNKEFKLEIQHIDLLLAGLDKLQSLLDDVYFSNQVEITELVNKFRTFTEEESCQQNKKESIKKKKSTEGFPVQTNNKISESADYEKSTVQELKIFEKNESVRLNITVLDKLMRLAGELVLIRNRQLLTLDQSNPVNREVTQRLDNVTSDIQEAIMQTRLQPIGNIFSKFPRVVRDMSRVLKKEISLQITGNEVELDKTILESLAAPLTHLVRNACDHGIEMPDERTNAGKRSTGIISLDAFHEGGLINIVIADDGKGIDLEKVKKKALQSNLKTYNELVQMSGKEIINMIMLPGFSTASEISAISGRGVGMDVVKANIEKLGGSIEIQSKEDAGTTFYLKLPLTLAIVPSMILISGDYRYAIPQVNVEELVTFNQGISIDKIEDIGDQEVFRLREKLLPLVRISEILNRTQAFTAADKSEIVKKYKQESGNQPVNFVVVSVSYKRYGLIFDKVIGTEEIVVQSMHPVIKDIEIYSGSTILGDGKVALILDSEGIANHANVNFNLQQQLTVEELKKEKGEGKLESLLLLKNGVQEQFAVPIALIKRIEEVNIKDIQYVGGKEFIAVHSVSHRVLRLEEVINVSPFHSTGEAYLLLLKFIKNPIGILFSELIDIQNISVNINPDSFRIDGLLGNDVLNGRMTLFLDVFRCVELAEPEWFIQKNISMRAQNESIPLSARIKILLVDDSSIFRQMVEQYLVSDGYEVVTSVNGLDALEKIKEQEFNLVISDLAMPNMDGFEFIETLRKGNIQNNIPAIALSAMSSDEISDTAIESGFNIFEVKIDKDHLLEVISNLLHPASKGEIIRVE